MINVFLLFVRSCTCSAVNDVAERRDGAILLGVPFLFKHELFCGLGSADVLTWRAIMLETVRSTLSIFESYVLMAMGFSHYSIINKCKHTVIPIVRYQIPYNIRELTYGSQRIGWRRMN